MSGISLIKNQIDCLRKLNVPIYCGVFVKSLLRNNKGRITGVEIIDGHRHNKSDQGTKGKLGASKAVIFCSGGFGSDIAFRQAQDPRLGNQVMSTNKIFTTAEVLKECLHIGANAVQLSRIQLGPWASPDEKGYGAGPLFGDYVVIPYGRIVNPQSGQRFVNELCNRKMLTEALLSLNYPSIGIADASGVEVAGWDLSNALKNNVLRVFPTIKALATHYKIDEVALNATIIRYNEMIKADVDRYFQKPILQQSRPIEKPPFYAMRMWPKGHYTMGGLQIDEFARVIDRDQKPIEGLLAAGEVTGGIHGACRLGSCAITKCLVFGRIAGRTATLINHD